MNTRAKALVTFLLVGAVIGVMVLQSNGSLFKGSIKLAEDQTPTEEAATTDQKPDLRPSITIVKGETATDDLKADVTIENLGPGSVKGDKTFKYTIYMNDVEVFSNTDSYTMMAAGDSFNFVYPIPRTIYEYPDSGTAKVVIDVDNNIDEEDEGNNEREVEY